jgi:hypothetical protein
VPTAHYLGIHISMLSNTSFRQIRCNPNVSQGIDSNVMSFSKRVAISARISCRPLMYSLPVRRLKEILSHIVPGSTLVSAEELPSTQVPRLYILTMSDGQKLILSFAPSLSTRVLRHESTMVSAEAALVSFIAGTDQELGPGSTLQASNAQPPRSAELFDLVPKMLKHSSNNKELAYPYSIFEAITGTPLSALSIYLSLSERRLVDKQVGSMARKLASLTSPSGLFGPVSKVLPDPFTPASSSTAKKGSTTWSETFHSLLEGVLRDGEDMSVLLPYENIRAYYQQLSWCLDAVKVPRLSLLDAGSETNVMIERGSADGKSTPSRYPRLTGLRSWGQGVFGDPLVSSCFEDASEGFCQGWSEGVDEIIEDTENTETRLLLYKCFRAVVSIVTEYYRPRPDSSRKELEGRRRLTSALAELDKREGALKRVRSSSANEDSSKRLKAEEI